MEMSELLERARQYIEAESDETFKNEVRAFIEKNTVDELEDRFYKDLEFGTGGIRGIIGGGTNRMNPLMVKKATQGLSSYMLKTLPENKTLTAVIAHDSRHYSKEFALASALIFAANGIHCYLFSALRPTPELSFAIRELGCDTGLVITASHNPPAYNGYKAYWSDGAQVTPPHDAGIIQEVHNVKTINIMDKDEAVKKGLLTILDDTIDKKYWSSVQSKLRFPDLIKNQAQSLKIVYTPLHGTGAYHIEKVLPEMGFNVITVPEQREPDGNFPTVSYPNPEDPKALKMAFDLAKKEDADIVIANDPDADRFACAFKDSTGDFSLLSGNQIGALYTDYVLVSLKETGALPPHAGIVRSIVSTHLVDRIAAHYGADCVECLTGFKWIAGIAAQMEASGTHTYVYGFEESYGYNFGTDVRDKDGIAAAAVFAEMTLYWRNKGKTIRERLDELFEQYGYFGEKTINKIFPGSEGAVVMQRMMKKMREHPPREFAGILVEKIRDIQIGEERNIKDGSVSKISIPQSNVLQYFLENGTVVSMRPSGTEPKIKFYVIHFEPVKTGKLHEAKKQGMQIIQRIEQDLDSMVR